MRGDNLATHKISIADLKRRLLEHNTGKDRSKFTCVNGPWDLFFYEVFETRIEAMKHEKFLKTGRGREYIKQKADISLSQSGRGSVW